MPEYKTQNIAPSSSGGQGGIFGNASAAIGDLGLGNSEASTGDIAASISKYLNIAAPVQNKGINTTYLIYGALAFGVYLFAKRKRWL